MADGPYRFPSGAGQQHYYSQLVQSLGISPQRPTSPVDRGYYPHQTSPSRSPGPASPTAYQYTMYNQSSHNIMNGAGHQRFGIPIGMSKPYQHQSHPHQPQHHTQQDAASHASHAGAFTHHQHTHSGGAGVSNGAHYGAAHLQNGTPTGVFGSLPKQPNEHWGNQIQLAQQQREWTTAHPRARNAQGLSKNLVATSTNLLTADGDREERQRPGTDDSSNKPKDQSWTELDMGGQTLRLMTPVLFTYDFLTRLYFNNNRLRELPPDISRLRSLRCLDLSLNELRSLPTQIGMLVNLRELLLFDNRLETLPVEVGQLFQCEMLGVEGNPLNEELKGIIVEHGTTELIKYLRESAPPPEPPEDRHWIMLDSTSIPEEDKVRVLNYNTLCRHYCTSNLYGYSSAEALSWEHRREVIMAELRAREPDIMCLQEVEHDAFETYFRPSLAHLDYRGVFWPKGRAKTMAPSEAKLVDGCATFYKNSKYILLDKKLIDLPSAAINRPDMKGEDDIYNRVMPKDNVAVVTFLEDRMTGSRIIVVNAHLHWDQMYKDVKVVQVAVLLEQISKLAETYVSWPPLKESEKKLFRYSNGDSPDGSSSPPDEEASQPKPSLAYTDPLSIPLLICSDLNSLPNSGPYELISEGRLAPDHADLENRRYGKFTRDGIQHPFALKSAYSAVGELPFTNYVSNFTGTVDYIWYSNVSLVPRELLGPVDAEYIARVPGFPNVHFPSDHVSLMAEFGFKHLRRPLGTGGMQKRDSWKDERDAKKG